MLGSVLETSHGKSHRTVSRTAGVCNVRVGIVIPLLDQAVGEVLSTISRLLENKARIVIVLILAIRFVVCVWCSQPQNHAFELENDVSQVL